MRSIRIINAWFAFWLERHRKKGSWRKKAGRWKFCRADESVGQRLSKSCAGSRQDQLIPRNFTVSSYTFGHMTHYSIFYSRKKECSIAVLWCSSIISLCLNINSRKCSRRSACWTKHLSGAKTPRLIIRHSWTSLSRFHKKTNKHFL